MENPPLVTVYIPCRNYGRYLSQAVDSVFAQLYDNWELFLINEASDDDTLRICNAYAARDPDRVTVIDNATPLGLQRGANTVLQRCNGVYIMRLDADDWLDECALLLMAAKLSSDTKLGIVYGNYFYTDQAGTVLGMERRHELGTEDSAGHLPPHGACTMVRTRALKAVGGYTESINAQDGWELWYKVKQYMGSANLNVPVFYYRQHETSLSRDADRLLTARSKIFQGLSKKLEGSYALSHLAVLGVKESYPDLPGIPYRTLDGVPLLERALGMMGESKSLTTVMVSSKSDEVLAFAEGLEARGAVPAHMRRKRDTFENGEYLPVQQILEDAGAAYIDQHGHPPDLISFHSLHTFNCTAAHIDSSVDILRVGKSDSVISVQEEKSALFSYGTDGLRILNPGRLDGLTYDRERVYRFNGAIITTWWDMVAAGHFLGVNIGYLEMSPRDSQHITKDILDSPAVLATT